MKIGKRIPAVVLVLLVFTVMSACNQKESDAQDWVWARSITTSEGALSNQGYYYIAQGSFLSYADFTVADNTVLCTKAGCNHQSENCEAYMMAFRTIPMFFHNEHLYYIGNIDGILYRRNETGVDLLKIGIPGNRYVEEGAAVEIRSFAQAGEFLYYNARVSSASKSETDEDSEVKEAYCIGRIHLSTGMDEILIEEKIEKSNESIILYAVRRDELLYGHWEGVDEEYGDTNYVDALQTMSITLNRWSSEMAGSTMLFRKTRVECMDIQMVSGGKVYCATSMNTETKNRGNAYTYNLDTGEEQTVREGSTLYYLSDTYALCRDNDADGYILIELKSIKVLPVEISSFNPRAFAVADKGLVMKKMVMDAVNPNKAKEAIYCYITYESMKDGLQEADLLPLYTYTYG